MRFSAVPSPDHRSVLPDRPENFPAFRHGYTADAHGPCGSAPVSGVPEFSPGAGSSAAAVLLWLSRCGDRRDRFSVGSMASRSFSKVGCIRHFYWFVVHYTQSM